jgi:hypothetical protein
MWLGFGGQFRARTLQQLMREPAFTVVGTLSRGGTKGQEPVVRSTVTTRRLFTGAPEARIGINTREHCYENTTLSSMASTCQ